MKRIKLIMMGLLLVVSVLMIGLTLNYAKDNLIETVDIDGGISNGGIPNDGGEVPSSEEPEISNDGDAASLPDGEVPELDIEIDSNMAVDDLDSILIDSTTKTLTVEYILFIAVFVVIISLITIYLIMSKFGKEKVFVKKDLVIIYILANLIVIMFLLFGIVYFANNYYLNSSSDTVDTTTSIEYSSSDDLHIDMSNWSYDSSNNVYYQIGLVYVSDPATVEYESLGIYVPGDYLDCDENSDSTYTCEISDSKEINGYTASSAPIVMPVNTAGYSAQAAPTSYSYNEIADYMEAGFIYVYAGCRGRNNGDDYSGGAPWGVTDLKAAIRYIRYNASSLPGDTDLIFAFGHSGGGAQSSVLGTSGDSSLYTPYLEAIGAIMEDDEGNYISDAITGVMAWCPITSLDYANAAYEWNMGQYMSSGTRNSSTWTSALSLDMAEVYAEYINALGLVDEDGNILSLTSTSDGVYISGTYYDYLLKVINNSLNDYLTDNYTSTSDMQSYIDSLNESDEWVSFDTNTNTATINSIEDFVIHCKNATKDVGAFDDLNRSQAENYVFGNDQYDALHFDAIMSSLLEENASLYSTYSDYVDYSKEYSSDLELVDALGNNYEYRMNMYNPMYYISDYYEGYETSNVAQYWRIRSGITQGDTALTVETNLALALENYSDVSSVDFATVWEEGHTEAERTGNATDNFIAWVNECLG